MAKRLGRARLWMLWFETVSLEADRKRGLRNNESEVMAIADPLAGTRGS